MTSAATSKITNPDKALSPTPESQDRAPAASGNAQQLLNLVPFLGVLLAACLMFFSNLGHYPLFNPDEALYAEPAREMLDTGQYITTLLNYVVRFTKPPLVIWAMALSYKLFGVNEFAARYFTASCGLLLVAATYLFLCRYAGRRPAFLAAFSLVTAPMFVGTAREAITDMPLSLFIAGALMAFFHGFNAKAGTFRWLGYVLVGLAVMTKGPVGLILPAGIMLLFHMFRRDLKAAWSYYRPVTGLLLVAALSLPWFATEIWVTHGAYYQEFLVRENFQRFTSIVDHKGAWWYHLAAVAGGFFPWIVFAPQALLMPLQKDTAPKAPAGGLDGRDCGLLPFCALSLLIILAFFSASVSKLLPYTLPAFPFLAALVAVYLDEAIERRQLRRIAAPLLFLAAAGSLALYVVPAAIVHLRELPPALPSIIQQALLWLSLSAAAAFAGVCLKRPGIALAVLSAAVFVCFLNSGSRALDVLSAEWEGPIPAFSRFAALSGQPIVVFHMRKPSITFYCLRQVLIPADEDKLFETVSALPCAYIIGKTADLPVLSKLPDCRVLVRQGRFVLMLRQAAPPH